MGRDDRSGGGATSRGRTGRGLGLGVVVVMIGCTVMALLRGDIFARISSMLAFVLAGPIPRCFSTEARIASLVLPYTFGPSTTAGLELCWRCCLSNSSWSSA